MFSIASVQELADFDRFLSRTPQTCCQLNLVAWSVLEITIHSDERQKAAPANDASRSIAQIIKLTQTDKGNFADALGTGEVTVADGAVLCFLWYDTDVDQAVFGYSDETTASDSDNKITKADTFVEIVRLNMTESSYTHFLDADNFVFV